MDMRKAMIDVYKYIVSQEDLLRLLAYDSVAFSDSPLSESKVNILDMPTVDRKELLDRHVLRTSKSDDLEVDMPITRLCIYPGKRGNKNGYVLGEQDIVFDVYATHTIDQVDFRVSWICDTLNSVVNHKDIAGIGKFRYVMMQPINTVPKGYIGYKLVYQFTGMQKNV